MRGVVDHLRGSFGGGGLFAIALSLIVLGLFVVLRSNAAGLEDLGKLGQLRREPGSGVDEVPLLEMLDQRRAGFANALTRRDRRFATGSFECLTRKAFEEIDGAHVRKEGIRPDGPAGNAGQDTAVRHAATA